MNSLARKSSKRKLTRTTGNAIGIIIPQGYRDMQAKLNAPAPAIALTITFDETGLVRRLRLAGETADREPRGQMTIDHPVLANKLAGLEVYDTYTTGGMTVRRYVAATGENASQIVPALIPTGPASALIAEPLPAAVSPARRVAAEIEAEAPHLGKRVAKGLAYFEAGQVDFPRYRTSYDWGNGGRVIRECDCPDAFYRGLRAEFGRACAHTIAQEIAYRLTREYNAVRARHIADRQDRRRAERSQVNVLMVEMQL